METAIVTNDAGVKRVGGMSLMDFSRQDGVGDLPASVKGKFAKALMLEAEAGKTTTEALAQLDAAVQYEANALAAS